MKKHEKPLGLSVLSDLQPKKQSKIIGRVDRHHLALRAVRFLRVFRRDPDQEARFRHARRHGEGGHAGRVRPSAVAT